MSTPIADMIERLVAGGVAMDLVLHAVKTAELVRGQSAETSADSRRLKDRERKRAKRELANISKHNPKANDVGQRAEMSAEMSAETADTCCDLSSFLSVSPREEERGLPKEDQQEKKEARSKSVATGKNRGTRLSADWLPKSEDRQFAIDHGMTSIAFDKLCSEFVDYWVSVPGQRGLKLNWSATLRNRVRFVVDKGKPNGQPDKSKSVLAAADRLISKLTDMGATEYVPGSSGPRPLQMDFGPVPPGPKLISSR